MSKEEILKRAFFENCEIDIDNDPLTMGIYDAIDQAMTEYAHRAIEEAAESAELTSHPIHTTDLIVDKQSILKLKEKY